MEDEAKGYFVEIRPIENPEWIRCNTNYVTHTSFTVIGLKAMAMYWVRVIAINDGGEGEPHGFDDYIIAMPPPGNHSSIQVMIYISISNAKCMTVLPFEIVVFRH